MVSLHIIQQLSKKSVIECGRVGATKAALVRMKQQFDGGYVYNEISFEQGW